MFDPTNTAPIYPRLKIFVGFFLPFSVYLPAGFVCGKCVHAQKMAVVSSPPCHSLTEAALSHGSHSRGLLPVCPVRLRLRRPLRSLDTKCKVNIKCPNYELYCCNLTNVSDNYQFSFMMSVLAKPVDLKGSSKRLHKGVVSFLETPPCSNVPC